MESRVVARGTAGAERGAMDTQPHRGDEVDELVGEEIDERSIAVRQLLVGVMLVVVGVVITAATYQAARTDGDKYFLAFGPIVVGAIAMVRGLVGLLRP
jgi:hypothetical protein